MEKINYISRKEEIFWKILRVISGIIYTIFLVVGTFSEESRPFFLLLVLGCLGLFGITSIPQRFNGKDISEIRKRMLSWACVSAIYIAFVAILVLSQAVIINPEALKNNLGGRITFLLVIAAPLVFFLLLETFKTKARESHMFFKYLVDEKPVIWKRLFYKDMWGNNYAESTLGIMFFVLLFAGLVAAILGWNSK